MPPHLKHETHDATYPSRPISGVQNPGAPRSCDICGAKRGVLPRSELRLKADLAGWIGWVCGWCAERFGVASR
jgi:hypothetical protein